MINETYNILKSCASTIPDWEKMTKSQLLRECIKYPENSLQYQAYMSAILCKYWYLINTYKEIDKQFASEEDIFGWISDALMYTLKNHKWDDSPEKYKENEPSSHFMTVFRCTRITAYQSSNRNKRKINATLSSVDKISDEYSVEPFYREEADDVINRTISNYHIVTLISQQWEKGRYACAFILDHIANEDVFGKVNDGIYLDINKLNLSLRKMDDIYAESFSEVYGIPLPDVKKEIKEIVSMSPKKIKNSILLTLKELSLDSKIKDMLC